MAFSSGSKINTNIAAYNALNALNSVNRELGVHQLRLASGKRINSASDDASGYVISKKMEGRLRAMNSALDNVGDAQSVLGVAEGGYQTVSDLLVQIKEKQARFKDAAMGSDEKSAIASEIKELATEIDDIVSQTKFNGTKLLNGDFGQAITQSGGTLVVGDNGGAAAGATIVTAIDVAHAEASTTYTFSDATGGNITLTKGSGAGAVSQTLAFGGVTAGTATTMNFDQLGVAVSLNGLVNGTAAEGVAALVASGTTVITGAAAPATFQVGEDSTNDVLSISFGTISSTSLLGTAANLIDSSNVLTLTTDTGIQTVNTELGSIGARIGRLSTKEANLTTAITNTDAAKSRIMDADIAKEQIFAVKNQILQQTATAQLAQANQSPQVFLSLFR